MTSNAKQTVLENNAGCDIHAVPFIKVSMSPSPLRAEPIFEIRSGFENQSEGCTLYRKSFANCGIDYSLFAIDMSMLMSSCYFEIRTRPIQLARYYADNDISVVMNCFDCLMITRYFAKSNENITHLNIVRVRKVHCCRVRCFYFIHTIT